MNVERGKTLQWFARDEGGGDVDRFLDSGDVKTLFSNIEYGEKIRRTSLSV